MNNIENIKYLLKKNPNKQLAEYLKKISENSKIKKYYSKILNQKFIWNSKTQTAEFEDGIVYTGAEIINLSNDKPESIKTIHELKKLFPGEAVRVWEERYDVV